MSLKWTYTPAEVSEMLGVHVATVYRRIEEGKLPVVRFGRCVRIPIELFHVKYPDLRGGASPSSARTAEAR